MYNSIIHLLIYQLLFHLHKYKQQTSAQESTFIVAYFAKSSFERDLFLECQRLDIKCRISVKIQRQIQKGLVAERMYAMHINGPLSNLNFS